MLSVKLQQQKMRMMLTGIEQRKCDIKIIHFYHCRDQWLVPYHLE